jgi:hypothetical protein
MRKRIAAWWLAYRKRTEGFCEKHQKWEQRFIGCEECFLDQVREQKRKDDERKEAQLRHEAQVYAEEFIKTAARLGQPGGHA